MVFELEPKTNLDAGVRRHDELSLPEGEDFNHPREATLKEKQSRHCAKRFCEVSVEVIPRTADAALRPSNRKGKFGCAA